MTRYELVTTLDHFAETSPGEDCHVRLLLSTGHILTGTIHEPTQRTVVLGHQDDRGDVVVTVVAIKEISAVQLLTS